MPINLNKLNPFKVHNLIQLARPVPAHTNSKRRSNLKNKCYCGCACSQYVPSVVKDICKEVLKAIDPKKKRIKEADYSFTEGELDRYGNGSSRTTRRKNTDNTKDKLGCRLKGGSSLTDTSKITNLKLNGAEFLTIPDLKNSKTKRVRLIEEAIGADDAYCPSTVRARHHKRSRRFVDFNKKDELVKLIADEVKSAIAREKAGSDKLRTKRQPSRKLREAYQSNYSDVVELFKIGTRLETSSDDIGPNQLGRKRNMKLRKTLVPMNKPQEDDKKENRSGKLLKSKTIYGASCGDADLPAKPEKKRGLKLARAQGRENSINSRTKKLPQSGASIGECATQNILPSKYKKKIISAPKESPFTVEKNRGDVRNIDKKLVMSQILRGVASDERLGGLKSRRPSRYVDQQNKGERQSRRRSKSLSKRRCDTPSRERRKLSRERTMYPFSDYQFQALRSKAIKKMSTSRKDQGTSMGRSEPSRQRGGGYDSGKGDRLILKLKLRKSGTRLAQSTILPYARRMLQCDASAEIVHILDLEKRSRLSRQVHSRFDQHRSCDYMRVQLEEKDAVRGF